MSRTQRYFWTQRIGDTVALLRADCPRGYFGWPSEKKMAWLRENDIHQFFLDKEGAWQEYQGFDEIDPLRIRISDRPRANITGVDLNA